MGAHPLAPPEVPFLTQARVAHLVGDELRFVPFEMTSTELALYRERYRMGLFPVLLPSRGGVLHAHVFRYRRSFV